jgi:hypothetical protein
LKILFAITLAAMLLQPTQAASVVVVNTFLAPSLERAAISLAQNTLRERGFVVDQSSAAPDKAGLKGKSVLWMILDRSNSKSIDSVSIAEIDSFVRCGGSLLITIRGNPLRDGSDSMGPLLRNFRVVLNTRAVGAKVQKLNAPLFKDLRLFSPTSPLLDVGEEALSQVLLIPNDLKQPMLVSAPEDRPGYRAALGKLGAGRLAVFATNEEFEDSSLSLTSDQTGKENDNREILVHLFDWLAWREIKQ